MIEWIAVDEPIDQPYRIFHIEYLWFTHESGILFLLSIHHEELGLSDRLSLTSVNHTQRWESPDQILF